MNFKFWKPKPAVKAEIKTVAANSLTVAEWRSIPALVTESQKAFSNPSLKAMLDVLRNDAPHNYSMVASGAQPVEYAKRVGAIEGYLMCLNNLEAMAKPLENNATPEATFEPVTQE